VGHVVLERSLDGVTVGFGIEHQRVLDVDSLDHQYAVLDLDLAERLAREPPFSRHHVARLQRAPEGPGQSAPGGGNDEVECGRALDVAAAHDAIVVGHLIVDAKLDRFVTGREVRTSQRPADPLDVDA
jgi:hypothetical protein